MYHFIRFLRSFGYSFQGIVLCIKRERNFRLYLLLFCYAYILGGIFGLSRIEFGILTVVGALVLSAEALNTAIETGLDFASRKQKSPMIKVAKDAASAGVFLSAMGGVVVLFLLFGNTDGWKNVWMLFRSSLLYPFLLLFAVLFLVWFVFLYGKKKKPYYQKRRELS